MEDTNLEEKEFQRIENYHSEESWIQCWVADNKFRSFGDPSRLEEILSIFVNWAKTQNDDWLKPLAPLSDEEQQKVDDEIFWNSLGEEVGPEICKHEECNRKRIQLSVMCRRHHFVMVKKRVVPQGAS